MFKLSTAHGTRRARTQEQDRTERHSRARRPANEVKKHRAGYSQGSEQKPWR
jgi:hypothetical protein